MLKKYVLNISKFYFIIILIVAERRDPQPCTSKFVFEDGPTERYIGKRNARWCYATLSSGKILKEFLFGCILLFNVPTPTTRLKWVIENESPCRPKKGNIFEKDKRQSCQINSALISKYFVLLETFSLGLLVEKQTI